MDRSRIAEFVLSSVLPRERAAAVVGDFAEGNAGWLWVWSSVIRIVCSRVWDDWREAPLQLVGIGALGFALNFVSTALCALCFGLASFPFLWLMGWARNEAAYGPVMLLASIVAAYSTGRWAAENAPGRELAALLALGIVPMLILSGVLGTIPVWGMEKIRVTGVQWSDLLGWVAAIYGALRYSIFKDRGAIRN